MAPKLPIRAKVLLISGSLRRGSTNSALLRTAQVVAPDGVEAVVYTGLDRLPAFNPDLDTPASLPGRVAGLRAAIRASDAILLSTPEYAGALPGSFKNLLDWTVGDDDSRSIYRKPVAWVNVSTSPTGAADAHESLRTVLGYVHATVVKEACTPIPVRRDMVGADGLICDPTVRARIAATITTLAAYQRGRAS